MITNLRFFTLLSSEINDMAVLAANAQQLFESMDLHGFQSGTHPHTHWQTKVRN